MTIIQAMAAVVADRVRHRRADRDQRQRALSRWDTDGGAGPAGPSAVTRTVLIEDGALVADIRVRDDLWATNVMPVGVLERWLARDGATVSAGQALATVRIEGALHDLLSSASGRLRVIAPAGRMVEPGSLVAQVDA